jgi:hypothetical protein
VFIVFAYIPFILDIYFDVKLAKMYYKYSNEQLNISELWTCGDIELNSSCYRRTGPENPVSHWDQQTEPQTLFSEDIQQSFHLAYWVTGLLLCFTFSTYIYSVYLHIKFTIPIDGQMLRIIGACSNVYWPVLWFTIAALSLFIRITGILIWPLVHWYWRFKYEASINRSQYKDILTISDSVWNNIKIAEYGLESSLQLLLQLWLLRPFLFNIASWDLTELCSRCVSGSGGQC